MSTETTAATSAIMRGPSVAGVRRLSSAIEPKEPAVSTSSTPIASEPRDSKRPWPYGWSESGGSEPSRSAMIVSPSEIRSDIECTASLTMAAEWPTTPA